MDTQLQDTATTIPASKPKRRRVSVTLTVNRELSRQIDAFARENVMTRSRLWERIALDWIALSTVGAELNGGKW